MKTEDIDNDNLFSDEKDWSAFLELADQKDSVMRLWSKRATDLLLETLNSKEYPGWGLYEIPRHKTSYNNEVRLYLTEFGRDGLDIRISWNFELHLHLSETATEYNSDKINTLLKEERFSSILAAFSKTDVSKHYGSHSKYMQSPDYKFESPDDGNFPIETLAWYAGNRTEEFVKQCIDKIERFTLNPDVTTAMEKLHHEATIDPLKSEI